MYLLKAFDERVIMVDLNLEKVNLNNKDEREEVHEFLKKFDLRLDDDVDYTITAKDINGNIQGTCSKAKSVFKCFAVSQELRGEGIASMLVTNLINKLFEEGRHHSFVFTKPDKVNIFKSLNFKLLQKAEHAALLEFGMYDINKTLNDMAQKYSIDEKIPKTAIVMNCNPFTLGHKYLIEKASECSDEVIVFIVEEDKSVFPFDVRYELARKGTLHLKNVKIIPGGEYIISSSTFPTYFLKEEDMRHIAYSQIDAGIFGEYFCPRFNIVKRFVGEEPYSVSTRIYNESLADILPRYGAELCIIHRKKSGDDFISASKVRKLLSNGKIDEVKNLVPESTWQFLNSHEGKLIIKKVKEKE